MHRLTQLLLATTLFAIQLGGFALDAQAQRNADGSIDLAFSDAISGESTNLDGVLEVLTKHTKLKGKTSKAARIVFVFGIGHGKEVSVLAISDPVQLVPGTPAFVTLEGEPLDSPWQAFKDPLVSAPDRFFDIYVNPVVAFGKPVYDYDDPVFNYDDPVFNYDDPARALAEIWRTYGVVQPGQHQYGLMLFAMPDPSSRETSQVTIQHSAAMVPFRVTESGRSGN